MNFNEITELLSGKLYRWGESLVKLLPNIFLAVIILVVGFYFAKLVRKGATNVIGKVSNNITLNKLFGSVVYMLVFGILIFTALSILQLDKAVTSILAGAGILGLALAFAFQDIASNFMSGIFISFRKPLKVGDIVKLKDYMGKVKTINLRDTVLQTFEGQTIIIPNKEVYQNAIDNYSYINKRRLDLPVRVSYSDDLAEVQKVTLEAVRDIAELSTSDEITVYFVEFADSSIKLSVRLWINSPEQSIFVKVRSEAIMKIKTAYDANKFVIPFPTRAIHLTAKGGKILSEMPNYLSEKK